MTTTDWTKVEDELPTQGHWVWVTLEVKLLNAMTPVKNVRIAIFSGWNFQDPFSPYPHFAYTGVTHWAPFTTPEPAQ